MRTSAFRAVAVAAVLLTHSSGAFAARSAEEICAEVAAKAGRTLWASVRESGDELFCRKPWMAGAAEEFTACGSWALANKWANKLKGHWNNTFSQKEWATWGARTIGLAWEEGTIAGGFKRTFFGAGLAASTSTFEIVKEGGRAAATLTVCELDPEGRVTGKRQRSVEGGSGGEQGPPVRIELVHSENRILGLVVDTASPLSSLEYRARLLQQPNRTDYGAVEGIADLHVHQFANVSFGGRMYWGHHSGPAEVALAPEEVNPSGTGHDLTTLEGLLRQLLERPGGKIDANIAFALAGGPKSDEGFWRYGGGGHPRYEDWPHHADRSHQQAHLAWVKEAHERNRELGSNLQLMVVSLVNNDVLCSVAKLLDPWGNVRRRDGAGRIDGWESSSWGCTDHENVTRQLEALHRIEREHPWYRIAMHPWHARQIIEDGDLAVVVSMETDKPLSVAGGSKDGNWERQLDLYRTGGLSTLQVVHESNSIFCGAAPHRDMMQWLQRIHWPIPALAELVDGDGSSNPFRLDNSGKNTLGITPRGSQLIDAMRKRNLPIDLAHGSERCRRDIMKQVGPDYALYDSHTKFEALLPPPVKAREKEFTLSDAMAQSYARHQVLIGLRTGSVDAEDAPNVSAQERTPNDCPGSARSFAQHVTYARKFKLALAYGSDFNTGVAQLGPRFGADRCYAADSSLEEPARRPVSGSEGKPPTRAHDLVPIAGTTYYDDGLSTIGWLPELTVDLVLNLKTPNAEALRRSAEAFLDMWERAYPPADAAIPIGTANGSVELGGSCRTRDECKSGRCTGGAGLQGVCVCNEDRDCGKGRWCSAAGVDLTKDRCEALKDDGESCATVGGGHQCDGGHCYLGHCYTPQAAPMGGVCYLDAACSEGKCSAIDGARGSCVCRNDSDCDADEWCDAGVDLKVNACRLKLRKGESCGKPLSFGNDHKCLSGECSGVFGGYTCK
jgi:microsomal dipeptidase-like Zn-dependent dipeptidase